MSIVRTQIEIAAPIERVFDLNLSVDLHVDSARSSGERVVGGVMSGVLKQGDTVTFEATHLGIRQRLTSRVTRLERPSYFRDEMVRGAFRAFAHDHHFEEQDGITTVTDVFDYRSPLGPLGRLANALFLDAHMARFLEQRLQVIKEVAESEEWQKYLNPP